MRYEPSQFIFIIGGIKSGKSRFAESLVLDMEQKTGRTVHYIATAQVWDDEMADRVQRHKSSRPGRWETHESPLNPDQVIRNLEPSSIILLDCLNLFMSNKLLEKCEDSRNNQIEHILNGVNDLLTTCRNSDHTIVVVSNEVGCTLVADNPLGRVFQDAAGMAHQRTAAAADQVYLVTAGIPQCLKDQHSEKDGVTR